MISVVELYFFFCIFLMSYENSNIYLVECIKYRFEIIVVLILVIEVLFRLYVYIYILVVILIGLNIRVFVFDLFFMMIIFFN